MVEEPFKKHCRNTSSVRLLVNSIREITSTSTQLMKENKQLETVTSRNTDANIPLIPEWRKISTGDLVRWDFIMGKSIQTTLHLLNASFLLFFPIEILIPRWEKNAKVPLSQLLQLQIEHIFYIFSETQKEYVENEWLESPFYDESCTQWHVDGDYSLKPKLINDFHWAVTGRYKTFRDSVILLVIWELWQPLLIRGWMNCSVVVKVGGKLLSVFAYFLFMLLNKIESHWIRHFIILSLVSLPLKWR